jgi:amino acid transporter
VSTESPSRKVGSDAPPTVIPGSRPPSEGGRSHTPLKAGSIGLVAVVFMAVANAAPITALTGNLPIAVGFGNGLGAPAGFLVATVILTIFAVGYCAMARHITAAGSFYGFITAGLGRIAGLSAGLLATVAYVVFEASIVGIFASFAKTTMIDLNGPDISWVWYALFCIAAAGLCGYFDISLSGMVLGVFLITEIIILSAMSLGVLFSGGGPDGFMPGKTINPVKAFSSVPSDSAAGITGIAAIGIFFAFWSWVGFETTAVYGEESKNPKKIVPRATLIAVIGLGLFYTFVSWMVIAHGGSDVVGTSRTDSFQVLFGPVNDELGAWAVHVYKVLTVTGSFACALAFHNAASRYIYAIGREGLSDNLEKTIGRTHRTHQSPHIASIAQTVITLLITLGFFWLQKPTDAVSDVPYVYLYGLLAIVGTVCILLIQTICSISVFSYFHIKGNHPETQQLWWRTGVAPILGAFGMAYACYLLFSNWKFAAGAASESPVFKATPWLVAVVVLAGAGWAVYLKYKAPERYERIGQVMMEDALVDTASDAIIKVPAT